MKRKCVKISVKIKIPSDYKMSKSDVSKPRASDANNQIVLTFEDALPEKDDGTIKIKKVSEFLGYDVTKLKIVGHNKSYFHNDDGTHHELTFVIKDKITKVVDKLVIDFVKKPNQKKFKGVVSLVTDAASSTAAVPKAPCNSGNCFYTATVGTQATAVYTSNKSETRNCPCFGCCDPLMAITLTSATTA
jgi:hypothetical protein